VIVPIVQILLILSAIGLTIYQEARGRAKREHCDVRPRDSSSHSELALAVKELSTQTSFVRDELSRELRSLSAHVRYSGVRGSVREELADLLAEVATDPVYRASLKSWDVLTPQRPKQPSQLLRVLGEVKEKPECAAIKDSELLQMLTGTGVGPGT